MSALPDILCYCPTIMMPTKHVGENSNAALMVGVGLGVGSGSAQIPYEDLCLGVGVGFGVAQFEDLRLGVGAGFEDVRIGVGFGVRRRLSGSPSWRRRYGNNLRVRARIIFASDAS